VNANQANARGDAAVRQFIANGFKLISRLDRDIGILIDNCLGFLYSIDLGPGVRKEIGQIESSLYDMVYMGRTPAGHAFKEDLFRTRILPIMKRIAPAGYYFGVDPERRELLGYWQQADSDGICETVDPLPPAGTRCPPSEPPPGS
jgi:hypothetical protein